MSDRSGIEWTDATWNPVTGCTKVSPGCGLPLPGRQDEPHGTCYAQTFAERFRGVPGHHFERGFDLQLRPGRLEQPLRWTRPRRIFVNSMSDLFHDQVPEEFIAQVFAVMAASRRHTFQLLTKRHGRMRSLLQDGQALLEATAALPAAQADRVAQTLYAAEWPLPNVWLGVSVEDQRWADIRIPALLDTPAAVRWISAEPLLGPVDLAAWLDPPLLCDCGPYAEPRPGCQLACRQLAGDARLDWIVTGGESGPGARPMHPDWASALRDQAAVAGVPFLFKQAGSVLAREWGGSGKGGDPAGWPEPFPRQYPSADPTVRTGAPA